MFEFVKNNLTVEEVVERYLGKPNKIGFYKSPFRNERTASLKASNQKGIHDFGTSKHYDIISFTAELYNCSSKEACEILIKEFNLNYNKNIKVDKKKIRERELQKKHKEEVNLFYDYIYDKLTTKLKGIRRTIESYKGKKIVKIAYNKMIKDYKETERLVDSIIYADDYEKEMIFNVKEWFLNGNKL